MSKVIEQYKTEIMFVLAALLVMYWVSTMSPKHNTVASCGETRQRRVEFMEPKPKQQTPKTDDQYWGSDNMMGDTLGEIDFKSKGPVLGTECAGSTAAFVSSDLLPKTNPNDKFNEFSPELKGMNMLDTSEFIGVDTVTNSLRNANYSIRSEPPNPKQAVSPWMNSTIAPDLTRLKLDC
jgi:hypothetical protein